MTPGSAAVPTVTCAPPLTTNAPAPPVPHPNGSRSQSVGVRGGEPFIDRTTALAWVERVFVPTTPEKEPPFVLWILTSIRSQASPSCSPTVNCPVCIAASVLG